ncbi:MAG: YicC/YloC family endoribonuclease [Pyrinomonadaceae bacterium]
MNSMTGFGRGTVSIENFSATVEIKTVNNRFLDINLRFPSELQPIEPDLKKLITERLSRGRVDVNLIYERNEEVKYALNRPLIAGYLTALKEMQEEFGLQGEPDMNYIARLPNALQTTRDDLRDEYQEAVRDAFRLALDELFQMRAIEGDSLGSELENRLVEIEKRMPVIESESEQVPEEYRDRLNKKIGELLEKSDSQIEIDQGRLAQEVAYLANRSDISEEIARLKSHIEQFRSIMKEDKDVGKRLDFLTQELNREANTIASKTNNLTIKECSLSIKAEIEKIREQVQNVE